MTQFIDYFYPAQKFSNDYLEGYKTNKNSNKKNTLIISIISLIYIILMVYTIYLLTKCLGKKDNSGNFINNISEFVVAIFFLPICTKLSTRPSVSRLYDVLRL